MALTESKPENRNSADSTELPLIIVNPKSAGGATEGKWARIASDFRSNFGPFSVAFTKSQGDATKLALEGARAGRKFIVACGGDGTINEVVNGLMESRLDVELGILPSGTGGDFRRSIGMADNARHAATQLRTGITRAIDVGRVTFRTDSTSTSRHFINVSSFGLSAKVSVKMPEKRFLNWVPMPGPLRGKFKFALATLEELSGLRSRILKVRVDGGEEFLLSSVNICICNASFFGGGMKIAPDASISDGHFDIVNISEVGPLKVAANLPKLYSGTHGKMEEVSFFKARRIEFNLADSEDLNIETDGEVSGRLPATFEIIPNALRLRLPKK
jgi:YegS/Rv2252/BmrU family lipid kinase